MRITLAFLAGVIGCYRPTAGDCEYRCAPTAPRCPGALTCDGEGFCRDPGAIGHACHDASVARCTNPDAGVLNPESCSCNTIGEQQPCFLGDNGPSSRCRAGGSVTCETTMRWGSCIGATGPSQELCFDMADDDCDGNIDNGCTCSDASNLCFDALGLEYAADKLVSVPATPTWGSAFTIYVLSKNQLFNLSYQPESGACTGAGFAGCTSGGTCATWFVHEFSASATTPWFSGPGTFTITVHVGDTGNPGPCVNFARNITGSITITP